MELQVDTWPWKWVQSRLPAHMICGVSDAMAWNAGLGASHLFDEEPNKGHAKLFMKEPSLGGRIQHIAQNTNSELQRGVRRMTNMSAGLPVTVHV